MAAVLLAPMKVWLRGVMAAAAIAALCPVAIAAPPDSRPDGAGKPSHVKARHLRGTTSAKEKPAGDAKAKTDGTKAESAKAGADKTEKGEADAKNPPGPPLPPYEPQILRLAEILGALAYLDDICGSKDDWRAKMQELLQAEAKSEDRKERLAGTFNRSFHDYEQNYQACTPNAQIVISRFLAEGGKLAREIVGKFSAS
jgi:uncharacterized protein (TIGR02301 family)